MLNEIINFILLKVAPPITVLLLTIGGISLYMAGQSPEKLQFSKKVITSAVIGLLLIYCSWLIINVIFTFIGVNKWTGLWDDPNTPGITEGGWFQIKCLIEI